MTPSMVDDTVGLIDDSLRVESENHGNLPRTVLPTCNAAASAISIETILVELREFRSLVTAHFKKQDARLDIFTNDIKDLQMCFKNLHQSCSSLKSEFDELTATVQNLTEENDSFRTITERYDKRLRQLESATSSIEQNLAATRIRVDAVEGGAVSITCPTVTKTDKQTTQVARSSCNEATYSAPVHILEESRDHQAETCDSLHSAPARERQRRRASRIRRSVIKATGEADAELRPNEPVKYIHIWNLHVSTTAENVLSYMRKKIEGNTFTANAPPQSHESHRCFIVGVPAEHFAYFMSPANWPKNVSLQEWFMYRNRRTHANTSSGRTFFRQKSKETIP